MTHRLPLPPNETPLEYALAHAMAMPDDLVNLPQTIEERLENPHDSELPFLIWEWGLQPVLPYLKEPRKALAQGRRWQKRRGTIGAGHTARSWIDVHADHEQNELKRFQLHLNNLPSDNRPHEVIALSNLSKSLRNRLVRLTHDLDGRAFKINGSFVNGLDCVGDWTGVNIDGLEPVVSFASHEHLLGDNIGLEITPTTDGLIHISSHAILITMPEEFVMNASFVNALTDHEKEQAEITTSTHTNLTIFYSDTPGPLQPQALSDDPLGLPSALTTFNGD